MGRGSIRLNTGDLEEVFEFIVAVKPDFDRAFASAVAEIDLGAKALLELVLQVHHVKITAWHGSRRAFDFLGGLQPWATIRSAAIC